MSNKRIPTPEKPNRLVTLFSTSIASIATRLSTNMTVVAKTRMLKDLGECSSTKRTIKLVEGCKNCLHQQNTFKVLKELTKQESWKVLFRGAGSQIYLGIIRVALFFPIYEDLKYQIEKNFGQKSEYFIKGGYLNSVISACIGRTISMLAYYPFEHKMTNEMADSKLNYKFKLKTMYIGFQSAFFRDLFFSCIFWPISESTQKFIRTNTSIENEVPIVLAGSLAGANVAAVITFPLDAIRDFQIIFEKEFENKSIIETGRIMIKNNKISDFYSSLKAKLSRTNIGTSVFFFMYPFSKNLLESTGYFKTSSY